MDGTAQESFRQARRRFFRGIGFVPLILLASCGPRIHAQVDKVTGRLVTITNADTQSFVLQRLVANGDAQSASCNDSPNKSLAPGESYSTTFIVCGAVTSISVETDRGHGLIVE